MGKKIIIAVSAILVFIGLLDASVKFSQAIPYIIFWALAYYNLKEKKKNNFWIVLLSILMAILNFVLAINSGPLALFDVVVWITIAFLWWDDKK